ncbi:MFS transporter [Streptomyces sp. NBC_01474]|uniref:MFS transporter n=1 Tax=Streptomyces sp. NBC_01474 TaxID=2903880 RepID=UPI002DD7BF03|nr:MFS transporter [Streptomyces sp. NBC_01474]WSD94895.1 MFS transporter [Streptomyces sp. NBC_01474]
MIALIWPTQLLVAVGILGANATASVAEHFHTTQVVWFTLIITLGTTMLAPFVIKLGDMHGKKRVMLAMIGLGVIGEVIATTATSFPMLLVGRGIASFYGPLAALSFPTVRDIFPRHLVKSASAILGSSLGLVSLASPFLGGWLIDSWGYEGALWFIVAATAVAFLLVLFVVPETPRHSVAAGFDWIGGIVLGGALASIVYALAEGPTWGWASGRTWVFIGAGLAAIVAFVFIERTSSHPIIDLKVLSRRPVAAAVASGSIAQAVVYSAPVIAILLALYPNIPGVSAGFGWTTTHNAVIGVSWNVVLFAAGIATSRVLRRADARAVWRAGLAVTAVGFLLAGFFHGNAFELTWTMCVASLGSGLVVATAPVLVVSVVTVDEQGLGSGMLTMFTNVGGAVFTAVMYAALDAHSVTLKGTAFYQGSGYSLAFWAGAGFAVVALGVSALIPRLKDSATGLSALPLETSHAAA